MELNLCVRQRELVAVRHLWQRACDPASHPQLIKHVKTQEVLLYSDSVCTVCKCQRGCVVQNSTCKRRQVLGITLFSFYMICPQLIKHVKTREVLLYSDSI